MPFLLVGPALRRRSVVIEDSAPGWHGSGSKLARTYERLCSSGIKAVVVCSAEKMDRLGHIVHAMHHLTPAA